MATLRTYTNRTLPRLATVSPGSAAQKQVAQGRVAMAAAGTAVALHDAYQARQKEQEMQASEAIASRIGAEQSANWEETQNQAHRDGFYEVDGQQLPLVEGRVAAYGKWQEQTTERLNQIPDLDVRQAALDRFTETTEKMNMEVSRQYRNDLDQRTIQDYGQAAAGFASMGDYEGVKDAFRKLVDNGFMDAKTARGRSEQVIGQAEESRVRQAMLTYDDEQLGALSDEVYDNRYLSADTKKQISTDALKQIDSNDKDREAAKAERQQQNLYQLLSVGFDDLTYEQIRQADIPEINKESLLNRKAMAGPNVDTTAGLEEAAQIKMDVMMRTSTLEEGVNRLNTISGLSEQTRSAAMSSLFTAPAPQAASYSRARSGFSKALLAGYNPDSPQNFYDVFGDNAVKMREVMVEYQVESQRLYEDSPSDWTFEKEEALFRRFDAQLQGLKKPGTDAGNVVDKATIDLATRLWEENNGDSQAATDAIHAQYRGVPGGQEKIEQATKYIMSLEKARDLQ